MASNSYENKKAESGRKVKVHFDLPKGQKHSSTSSISSQSSDDIDNKDNIDNFDSKSGYGSPVWSFQSGTTTTTTLQSPPRQYMTSPSSGYDPNRIPSSIFSNRPTSPMDWSVASNESLFSLHLGNNSFSRDNPFIFNNNYNTTKSGELPMPTSTTLPTVEEVNGDDEKIVELERHSLSSDTSEDELVEDLDVENEHKKTSSLDKQTNFVVKDDDDHGKNETSPNVETTKLDKIHGDDHIHSKPTVVFREEPKNYITSVSYRSVESDYSNHSFQFPILTADGVRISSETEESEKQEKYVKQHQHQQQQYQQQQQQQKQQKQQQQSHKPVKPPSYENYESYENEKTPKKCCRSWCCCCCYFSCSPCSRCF